MKNYTITVNGTAYSVTVEENNGGASSVVAPVSAPVVAPKAAPKAAAPVAAGGTKIEAATAGKIFKIEASVGQSVKAGDAIVILEAMKMEIPVVAPVDGTVASINVSVGDAVENGDVLATMN